MRKKSYNFLERKEVWEKLNPENLSTRVNAKNNLDFASFKKWTLLFMLGMVLTFSAKAQISVSSTTGTGAGVSPVTYSTLKEAVDSVNSGYFKGAVTMSVLGNTTETAQSVLNASAVGSSSYTQITIKPNVGVTATITGSISTSIIKLDGADNVTIDGSNSVGGTSQDLTITNTFLGTLATSATSVDATSAVIWIAGLASGGNGATNNTIKNCIVKGSGSRTTHAAIISSASSGLLTSAPSPGNANNTITNNSLGYAQNIVRALAATLETGLSINNNTVDSAYQNGIIISNQQNFSINGNTLNNIATPISTTSGTVHGIQLVGSPANGTISFNKILKVRQNSTNTGTAYSARGITLASNQTGGSITVANNFIGDISAFGIGTSLVVHGILVTQSAASSVAGFYKIYNNTINLITPTTALASQTSCFSLNTGTLVNEVDCRNNIFVNNINSAGGNTNYWSVFNFTATNVGFQFLDNNVYYTSNSTGLFSNNPNAVVNLSSWQSYWGKDANSMIVQPTFVSSTDLHLQAVAGNTNINNGGTPLGSVTTDIDGTIRSTNYPDIGADEIIYTPKISSFTPSSVCAGGTVTINGADFTGATSVSLAGVNASSSSVISTSQITAVVAVGYTSPSTGTVSVTNGFGTGTSVASLTRLAPGTFASKSLSAGSTGDQVIISGADLLGASAVTFNGVSATFSITNSTEIIATVPSGVSAGPGTVLVTDICGNSINAGSFNFSTPVPCTTPTTQATSFVQSTLSTAAMSGSFTPASGNPSGYVVVYSTTGLTSAPVDGVNYTPGAGFGGIIKQITASASVSLTGLAGNTAYTVTIYSYNGGGCTGGTHYNTSNPLVYTFTTCADIPTSVTGTPIGNSSGNSINFSWSTPTGGSANALTYTLQVTTNAGFTSNVSGSPFTVSATSQSVTGLDIATKYYYRILANNGVCNSGYVSGNVTTVCGAIQTIATTAHSQDFEGVTTPALPSCWTTETKPEGNGWKTGVPTNVTGSPSAVWLRYDANGTYAGTGSNAAIAANDWVFSPGVYLTGGVSYSVSYLQAAYSNGESYLVKYGTAASSAGMTGANTGTLFSATGLRNTTPTAVAQAFTPTTSGVYYIGFYVNSAAYGTGTTHVGISLYIDNFKLQVTPPPPTAPSALTVPSFGSSTVNLSWTDNSNNEDGFYVYSSLDGSTYTLQTTVGAGVTTASVGNLNANTAYTFKVTAYNTGGESAGATTTQTTASCGGVYTTNTYVGNFFAGTIANWNLGANWSLGHAPLSCEDVVINASNLQESSTTICYLYLNANASMHNLTITGSNSPTTSGTRQALFVYTNGFAMKIGGDLVMSNDSIGNAANVNDNVLLIAGGGSGGASITIEGNATIGATGNRLASIGGASGFANIIFKGNVNLGPSAFLNYGSLVYYIFDANGNQTLTMTSTQTDGSTTYGLGNLTVGNTNNTTLTLAGSGNSPASAVVGDFLINSGSSLIIPSGQKLNRTVNGGNFTMGTNTTLKVGGSTGGVNNSNFPSNFAAFSMGNGSTVVYNGTTAQDVAAAPSYWHLTVNNTAGVNLTANTLVNYNLNFVAGKLSTGANTLTAGLNGTVTGAGVSSYVNGTFAKTKVADTNGALNFEIGDGTQYTPVFVGFNGVSNSGGIFSAKTTAGQPSSLGFVLSGISPTNYLNRKYTLSNNGVTGISSVYTVFNYASSDLVGNVSNSNYQVADSTYGGGWSLATTTNGTNSSSATNVLASGSTADFLMGEIDPAPAPDVSGFTPTSACEGSQYIITGSNFYAITGVTIGGINVPVYTVNSPTQITITIPVGIANGVIAVSNATATSTTAGSLIVNAQPQTTVGTSSQTVCSGATITTIVLGNSSNVSGTTYNWTRTGNISGGTAGTSGTTDINGTLVSSSTVNEVATFTVNSSANGCAGTVAVATVTVKASPGVVNLTPSSTSSICENNAQQLVANYTAATGTSVNNSGVITVGIPDGNIAGVNTQLVVNNIPTGAIITGIDVQFDITHAYNSDLVINLVAPNGKVLNLVNQLGATPFTGDFFGTDFYHTVVSSASGLPNFPVQENIDSATGTWAPDAVGGVGPSGFLSTNGISFSDLYSVPNGNWKLALRDIGTPDVGTLKNWKLTLHYTLSPTFSWSKVGGGYAGLYTDAGFTPYTGGSQQTVYAKNTPGSYQYTANISFNGCTANSNTATVDIQAVPITTRTPASQTVCSGTTITSIQLAASNDPSAILSWTRDHTSDITGMPGSGTGNITGALTNETSSPITVTFTITSNGSGSQFCSGNTVTSTVIVNPTPLASATPLSQNACSGSAITPIIFGTTNGVSGTNYTWTRDNTSAATGIASNGTQFVSGTLTNASTQTTVTFNITAVGPGSSACAGTPTTATVTVYNNATAYSVTGGGSYCSPGAGMPVGLSNSQIGYDYQLLLNGTPVGSPVNGNGSAISFGNQTASGTYTVLATNTGCSRPMNGSVVINAITTVTPTISIITSKTTICANTNATFFAVVTNTGSNPTYNFKVNGFSMQSGSSKVYITSTLTDGDIVSCTLTSNNTCQTAAITNSNEITMTVNSSTTLAAPAAITGNTTICTVGSYSYLASTTTGGVWSSSDPAIASVVTSGKVTAVANGTAIISYTISSSNGCTNSASAAVTVAENSLPASITGASGLCVGSSTTYSSTTSGGVWSATAGRVTINSSTGLATGTSAGSTTIRYTATNAAGCSKYIDYPVTVGAKPVVPTISYASGTANPQLGASGGYCINKTFSVVGTPTGGTWSSSNSSVVTVSAGGVVNTLALGSGSITYTYTSVGGCSNSRSIAGTVVNCAARGVDLSNMPKPEMDFTLFPNPAKGLVAFNAEFVEAGGKIVLTDMFGKTIRTQALSLGTNTIDISSISKGFYLVSVITTDGKKTKKLIIE